MYNYIIMYAKIYLYVYSSPKQGVTACGELVYKCCDHIHGQTYKSGSEKCLGIKTANFVREGLFYFTMTYA